jgi:Transposase DDE domain
VKSPCRRKRVVRPKVVRTDAGVRVRSKNELARLSVWKLVRRGLRVDYLLFDNWYASRANFNLFGRLNLHWVTRAKSNLKVGFDGQRLTGKQVGARVAKANYHYYAGLSAWARSFLVWRDGHPLKLTVIKDDRGPEGGGTEYLLTDDLSLSTQQVVEWYRRRWAVEVFFSDSKRHLGLGKCEARCGAEVIAHVVLVWLTPCCNCSSQRMRSRVRVCVPSKKSWPGW